MTTSSKEIFATSASNMSVRNKNTIAAAVGAVAGVGISALSERANATTIGATAVFGGLVVAGVYHNELLHVIAPDDNAVKGIVGTVAAVETALFGCVMNIVAGDTPVAE